MQAAATSQAVIRTQFLSHVLRSSLPTLPLTLTPPVDQTRQLDALQHRNGKWANSGIVAAAGY